LKNEGMGAVSEKNELEIPASQIDQGVVRGGGHRRFVRRHWRRGTHAVTGYGFLYCEKFLVRQAEEFF